ncbi:MAG: DUF3999 family protein, partial [Bacteroidota bacterium]
RNEIPYLLKISQDETAQSDIPLKAYNISKKNDALFFTIKQSEKSSANQATIELNKRNYDCLVKIDGSNDEQEWFEVASRLRIVSIDDQGIQYKSNTVSWPSSNFQFLRFQVSNTSHKEFGSIALSQVVTQHGMFDSLSASVQSKTENKVTEFNFRFSESAFISKLKLQFDAGQKFYRNFTLEVLKDSVKTEKGWVPNYYTLQSGVLASFQNNFIDFNPTVLQQLRLIVYNLDNPPIKLSAVQAFSPRVSLVAQLPQGDLLLKYGNDRISKPNYDLSHFTNEIPSQLPLVRLQNEQSIAAEAAEKDTPWFKNQNWLWAAMLLILGLLGYFTFTMIRKA